MPGVILHLIAGCALFGIGRYTFNSYFKDNQKKRKQVEILAVCIIFSILPDFFLGIYYTTHLEPFNVLLPYQVFTHFILTPIAVGALFLLAFLFDTRRRPLWIMGALALIFHIIMDLSIMETNLLI